MWKGRHHAVLASAPGHYKTESLSVCLVAAGAKASAEQLAALTCLIRLLDRTYHKPLRLYSFSELMKYGNNPKRQDLEFLSMGWLRDTINEYRKREAHGSS